MLIHAEGRDLKLYTCPECNFETKYKGSLRKHVQKHKGAGETLTVTCPKCPFETKHTGYLNLHMQSYHMTPTEACDDKGKDKKDIVMLFCAKCDYKTRFKYSLRTHTLKHMDPSEVDMLNCSECSYTTKYKKNLQSHILIHMNESEVRMFFCTKCDYKTNIEVL